MSETKTLLRDDERKDKVNEKITLLQKKDGLTFGTDAFLLAAYTEQRRSGVAAELGAGTGIISLCAPLATDFRVFMPLRYKRTLPSLPRETLSKTSLRIK